MDITSVITKYIFGKLIPLQSFIFSRPRIDIDLNNDEEDLYGQRSKGVSFNQISLEPIPIQFIEYDFEFYWNYIIRIRNNSSKTAYNLKIEKIYKDQNDYLSKLDEIVSLKDGETIELDYKLKHSESKNINEAKITLTKFPYYLEKIEIIISYTNESRKKFYTRFIATKSSKENQHLLRKPKNVA